MIKMGSENIGIKVISFDFGGVLSDNRKAMQETNKRIFEIYKGDSNNRPKATALTPVEFVNSNSITDGYQKLFPLYEKIFNETIESGIVPMMYPGAEEVLDYLQKQGYKLVVLSSYPQKILLKELERYKISDFFGEVFGESRDKKGVLENIAAEYGLNPSEILHVGDTVEEIRAAKVAGAKSAGICTGYHPKERLINENPDFVFDSLSDMIGVL